MTNLEGEPAKESSAPPATGRQRQLMMSRREVVASLALAVLPTPTLIGAGDYGEAVQARHVAEQPDGMSQQGIVAEASTAHGDRIRADEYLGGAAADFMVMVAAMTAEVIARLRD